MKYLTCYIVILSEKSLEEVAQIISNKLFGGIPFVGKDKHIYDEVPAIFIEKSILGLGIILQGFGGKDGYVLSMNTADYPWPERKDKDLKKMMEYEHSVTEDISNYVAYFLKDVKEIKCVSRN